MSGSSITPKIHPITGMRLMPIRFTGKDGTVKEIWPILGAEDNGQPDNAGGTGGTGDGSGTGGTGTGGTGGDGTGSTGGSGDGTGGSSDNETDPEKLRQKAKDANDEAARRRHSEKAARDELEATKAKLKEFEDKDRTELEKAQRDVAEITARAEKAEAQVKELQIHNAFLGSNKHSWQNGSTALKLADLSDVKIDEDGKVTGLDKALDKLAKEHAYLLKPDTNSGQGGSGGQGSGAPAGSGGQGHNTKDSRAATAARFPAAARRR